MNFNELEQIMSSRGVNTLAEIARTLNTTPQAVSNWKARNQVPHHVVSMLNKTQPPLFDNSENIESQAQPVNPQLNTQYPIYNIDEDSISLSDTLLTIAENLKVIFLTTFTSVFLTFIYVQFIQIPQYISSATVILPATGGGSKLGGLAGIASQFGVNVPSGVQADLSSPSLFPKLLRSRTFAEKILQKKFYTNEYGIELPLLAILTHGNKSPKVERDTLITESLGPLSKMLEFDQDPSGLWSTVKVTANEPLFAKQLADVVLTELEDLNRFYKSQTVNQKTGFISDRIASVENVLKLSEKSLKEFNERNRQISSPALQLEQGRLERDVEVQTGVYLTLKQQYELAKIEEVQEASIIQVWDKPQVSLGPTNKKLMRSIILAGILGLGLGVMIGYIRAFLNNSNMDERKKLRRVKHLTKKKINDFFKDRRISFIVSCLMLIGLPFFLSHESKNPVFFGRYSFTLMMVNTIYVLSLVSFSILFIYLTRTNRKY